MTRRRSQEMPLEIFRKAEGPALLNVIGETRQKLCQTRIPIRSPDYRAAQAMIEHIDHMAELLTGDRTYFHAK